MAPESQGSPKPKTKKSEPQAKPAQVASTKAETGAPRSLIWLGPVIRRPGLYVNHAQTFRGEASLPPKFKEMIAGDPEAKSLLVPVGKAGPVMEGLKKGGSAPAALAFARTAEKYKRVLPGQEGGN